MTGTMLNLKGHKMKLNPIASNQNEVTFNDGTVIFFSYKTPVAAFIPGTGYVRSSTKWSRTTTKHINKWLNGVNAGITTQSFFDNLVEA